MLPLWYSVLGWCLSSITVAGNGIVIYMIIRKPRLHRTRTNKLILSLAVADLCVGTSYFVTENVCHLLKCKEEYLPYAIGSFLSAASATNLSLLLIDRYVAIVKPLKYATLVTTERVVLLISTAWVVSFLAHLTFVLNCFVFASFSFSRRQFVIFDFVIFEILPLLVSSIATGHICLIAKRNSRQISSLMDQLRFNLRNEDIQGRFATSRRERPSAKLVGVAGSVFFICYLNEMFYTIYYQLLEKQDSPNMRYTAWLLNITNSAANPIAYALFKSDIKENLKIMFRCKTGHALVLPVVPLNTNTADRSNAVLK